MDIKKIAPYAFLDLGKLRSAAPFKERIDLFDVFGIINSRMPKPSEYGQSMTYVGRFEVVIIAAAYALKPEFVSKEAVLKGDRAFFPPELEQLIEQVFPKKGVANIQLGARIGVGPVPEGRIEPSGFVWVVQQLVQPSESKAVAMLRERAQAV